MPLNREHGEPIEGFEDNPHIVIEPRALANLSNFKTFYSVKSKFRSQTKLRPVFDDAVAHAVEAFAQAGAIRPIRINEDDVLVQVYPKTNQVAVMFQRSIAGKDHYVTRLYDLPPPLLDTLLADRPKATAH